MKMRFLPDEPVKYPQQDSLGFYAFVKDIQEAIGRTKTPFVYGILGDWGSGKTSVLSLLEDRLTNQPIVGDPHFVPIRFDAWRYENEANVLYPLLWTIKRAHDDQLKALETAQDFSKRFLEIAVTSALALTDVGLRAITKHFTGEAMTLDDIAKHLKNVRDKPDLLAQVLGGWVNEVYKLDTAFQSLIDAYAAEIAVHKPKLSAEDVRFVIMIDDLDRCLPDTTIAILESMKHFLLAEKCIFVLALNPTIVYQGIRVKYRGLEINGREYLEKVLNYSFYVPEPDMDDVAGFASRELEKLVLDEFESEAERARYRALFAEFGSVLKECCFSNPRKIKRILNRYLLFVSKFGETLDQYILPNIVRLIILAEYFPSLFQLFLKEAAKGKALFERMDKPHFIQDFEEEFRTPIAALYPQLSKMSGLFTLVLPTSEVKVSLEGHAQAVFSIARLF